MKAFRLLEAEVFPALNEIHIDGRVERLPSKFIDVLVVLAEEGDDLVSKAELLRRVWADPLVGDEALNHAVWVLRKALGDDAKRPRYIQTVPRRGYRLMVAAVELAEPAALGPSTTPGEMDAGDASPQDGASSSQAEPVADIPARPIAQPLDEPGSNSIAGTSAVPASSARWPLFDLLLIVLAVAGIGWLSWYSGRESSDEVAASVWRLGDRLTRFDRLADGRLLMATRGAELIAWSPQRSQPDWRLRLGAPSTVPTLEVDDRLYVASDDQFLYALDSRSGTELWRFMAGSRLRAQPALLDDSAVLADDHGEVLRLSLADRRVIWRQRVGGRMRGAVVVEQGVVLVGNVEGQLNALSLDHGELRWQRELGAPINWLRGLGAVDAAMAGDLLLASEAGRLMRIEAASQTVRWEIELGDAMGAPWFVGTRAFVLTRQGQARLIDLASGESVWRQRLKISGSQQPIGTEQGIAVSLAGAQLGLLDTDSGKLIHRVHTPGPIDWLQPLDQELALAGLNGDVRFLDLPLPSRTGDWQLLASGEVQPWSGGTEDPVIERAQSSEQVEPLWTVKTSGNAQDLNFIDGDLVVGDASGVYRLGLDGQRRWHFALQQAPGTQFRQAGDLILFGGNDGRLYAVEADSGRLRWQFATGDKVRSAPVVVERQVVFGGVDKHIYCLDMVDGRLRWRFATEGPVHAEVAVADGKVFAGSGDQHLYALSLADGALLWRQSVREWIVAAPLWQRNTLFVPVSDGTLRAFDPSNGSEHWRFASGGWIWFGLVSDGQRIFFASGDGHVYAVDLGTGRERWRQRIGPQAEGRLALAGGRLLAGSPEGYLYSLDPLNGSLQWRMRAGGAVLNPAAAPPYIAVGSADQTLHLLRTMIEPEGLPAPAERLETMSTPDEP
ncbi:PQQ-binding-like beta-propeller repeat protein [Pseudomarimonas arenosa]|uniref:PQQ-binding-like beta-propeller repeat protein n=1 Tax=Pseudomarimonas arenosa TaxID=2774145 RepID=A0AAW3ZL74_9GAMM|nr:PQQ-binding-like beta-propeller repeat protein [Pseudomarimonas arenosa]MBD8525670.1 PQQ-binding-like beta-propeller repeat protein [Pseudomarimonas arenosa]